MIVNATYQWLVFLAISYLIVTFCIGFYPFENSVVSKEFLSSNAAIKYTTVSAILLAMVLGWLISLAAVRLGMKPDARVLLTKM